MGFDRFDLEQQLMSCWNITDDVGVVLEHVMEEKELDRDTIANLLLGLQSLYELKFRKCFDTFETLVAARKVL